MPDITCFAPYVSSPSVALYMVKEALLDQVRYPLLPVQKGFFMFGFYTSDEAEEQGVFSSQAYQFFTGYKQKMLP